MLDTKITLFCRQFYWSFLIRRVENIVLHTMGKVAKLAIFF